MFLAVNFIPNYISRYIVFFGIITTFSESCLAVPSRGTAATDTRRRPAEGIWVSGRRGEALPAPWRGHTGAAEGRSGVAGRSTVPPPGGSPPAGRAAGRGDALPSMGEQPG